MAETRTPGGVAGLSTVPFSCDRVAGKTPATTEPGPAQPRGRLGALLLPDSRFGGPHKPDDGPL